MKHIQIGPYRFDIFPFGSNAFRLIAEVENCPYPEVANAIRRSSIPHDLTATDSELVIFGGDPDWLQFNEITLDEIAGRKFSLPICFEYGSDWVDYLNHIKMGKEFAIGKICSFEYQLAFIGFLPGFLYLNGLPERFHCPRKKTPKKIDKGDIGIGGKYLGCYPSASQGGWHIIGRTPVSCLNLDSMPPLMANVSDRFTIQKIAPKDYKAIENSKMNLLEFNGVQD